MDTPLERITFCPHCGNRAPQTLLLTQGYVQRAWYTDNGAEASMRAAYYVAACATCRELLLYQKVMPTDEENFLSANMIWPQQGLDPSVPKTVSTIYEEARNRPECVCRADSACIGGSLQGSGCDQKQSC